MTQPRNASLQFGDFAQVTVGQNGVKNTPGAKRPSTNYAGSRLYRNPLATTEMNKNAPSKLNGK